MRRKWFRCRCINFLLLVPLCWLPLHLYLHLGHHPRQADFRHVGSKNVLNSPLNADRIAQQKQGSKDGPRGRNDAEQRTDIPGSRTNRIGPISRDRDGSDNMDAKWRETKLDKPSHLHSNKADVVRLTVRRKLRRKPDFSRDESIISVDSKRTKRNETFGQYGHDRPISDRVKILPGIHSNATKPFQEAGREWREGGPGEAGKPVYLSAAEQQSADATFDLNRFNLVVSEQIALNRTLPDVRPPRCRLLQYPWNLPKTSVIIVFHNEAWSTLLRTVTSVIDRSPRGLLQEIILVDDASDPDFDWLRQPLEDYIAALPVLVRVERLESRQGIVAARHLGVAVSKGEVLTFLDSHCECTTGWLEPLLERIARDRTRVPSPVIDSISDSTFEYRATTGLPLMGGFSWLPEFVWMEVPVREQRRVKYDTHIPLRTPTMAGGLFSIHRDFFHRLGGYDSGMRIWGGENLQLSFKVWQCGGSLEIIPCSHVGHVFRSSTPYDFPQGAEATVLRNTRRFLEVWTDSYTRELFYAMTPAYRTVDYGDVTGEITLRDRLGCKDFRWYLGSVYPEHHLPLEFRVLGAVKNLGVNMCLDGIASRKDGRREADTDAALELCHGSGPGQVFAYNKRSQLQHDRQCLTAVEGAKATQLSFCIGDLRRNAHQRWTYNTKDMTIVNVGTHKCLDVTSVEEEEEVEEGLFLAITNNCDRALSQQWTMHNITIRGFS